MVGGFSLHANVAVHADDKPRLERLARYCARPPIATERLERLADGRLLYRFKRPWRDGTTHVVFEPLELLEKLSALVPPPRAHLVQYSCVLAPASKWRPLIVPGSSSSSVVESPVVRNTAGAPEHGIGMPVPVTVVDEFLNDRCLPPAGLPHGHPAHYDSSPNRDKPSALQSGETIALLRARSTAGLNRRS